jgi:hypothetical protein
LMFGQNKIPLRLISKGDFSGKLSHYPTPFLRGGLRMVRGSAF